MPAPLEIRIHNRIVAEAVAVSGANVPEAQHYRRDVLAHSPGRDALPAVVVARTAGRVIGWRALLSCDEYVYPVTVLLLDTAGGQVVGAEAQNWRAGWTRSLLAALGGPSPLWVDGDAESVPEIHYVDLDALTVLDMTAYEGAGLWQSSLSVLVTVREYPDGRTNET
jgi:hypothetical protein